MCGRYASTRNAMDIAATFGIRDDAVGEDIEADYNVAPTKPVYAVVERAPREDKAAAPVRQLRVAKWGLVPSWAKDPSIGSRLINARVETVDSKPAFKKAFATRRCLLPADGYYEWYGEKGHKQPFFIHPKDGGLLAMAGLYEFWKAPHDEWLFTVTVLTTTAEDAVGHIHDRMPMLVEPDRWATWLAPSADAGRDLRELLVPAAPGLLDARPVSTLVNNVANNGPELLEPVEPEGDLLS
ncbi:MAG: hypothetical protein QOE64_1401 [Frankiales bacterium]|jgi:putative SOS response-associated peptidase YedK|nr:hypothetical protein [Frankiales bacterium]